VRVQFVVDNLDLYWKGFLTTLQLALISGLFALVLGAVLAAFRVSPAPPLRWVGAIYVEVVRNTPLTVVFFFVVFVAPRLDVKLPFFTSALVALSTYTAAFVCEALRSGVNGVPVGQAEAARSIGMTFFQTLSLVVLPQAFRSVIPPLINIFIALTKNSSVAGAFFVAELFNVGRRLANDDARFAIEALTAVALFYLLITIPSGLAAIRLERKLVVAR
jgi:glutamate transport system permease protein